MGFILFLMVAGVAGFSLVVTTLTLAVVFSKTADPAARKTLVKTILVISLPICAGIFFLPVDMGKPGSNYDIIFFVLSLKTALFILTPAVVALLCFFRARKKLKRES